MIRHPDSNLQIAEKIEQILSSQNKRVNTEGTNIVTNEFNREDYVINKAQTEISLQGLAQSKQDVLTAGNGININNNNVISVVWDWIKDKISSVLGLTSSAYGGKAATAGTADKVAKAITFSNDGAGAASGSTFDGSAARKLSWNSIGACPGRAAVLPCSYTTFVSDNITHARINAASDETSLVNQHYYLLNIAAVAVNNASATGNIYLNINNLGDKPLYWGASQSQNGQITREFSLPQGLYTARYLASRDCFLIYFQESFLGHAFQRYGSGYVTCFGRADVDSWYLATRYNAINKSVKLAFTGVDNAGYEVVDGVTVAGWSSSDSVFLMYYNHTDKTLTALSI
jgi:hypothetical protein